MKLARCFIFHKTDGAALFLILQRAPVVGILTRHDFMPEHILGLHPFLHKSKWKRLRFRSSTFIKYIRGSLLGRGHSNWNSADSEQVEERRVLELSRFRSEQKECSNCSIGEFTIRSVSLFLKNSCIIKSCLSSNLFFVYFNYLVK